ncbi:MAG: Unknown protein [uncultured Thiotrichaceae bacterium]|uniref:Tetratricopeptide repeat protein n=1 Tax=uncultured Thiotrichaceae bacterium TaxID=298394 RepID=A0A6S6TBM6_9GAMM|nr:MAG: Unknown protein [uncultured Thiotrichaceae bacterium]
MFIVRWLMSHPILFAWALAALAIILNWGTKSGVDHAESKDVVAVHSQQTTSEAKGVHSEKNAVNPLVEQQAIAESDTPKSPEQPVVPVAPVNELQKPVHPEKPGMNTAQDVVTTENSEQTSVASAVEVASAESVAPPAKMLAPTANVSSKVAESSNSEVTADAKNDAAPVPGSVDTNKKKTPDELLKAAREAFWQNKKDEAASIYKQLIEMQPDVLEHKGELGNVYWHQNKQKESAELYAKIAIPLINSGKSAQVENMLGFIGAFYPEKATEIHHYLRNNQ